MADQTNVEVLDEVGITYTSHQARLCFQAVRYHHPDGTTEDGFRFSWRDGSTGNLKVNRGQTRIPSLKAARLLMAMAEERPIFRSHAGQDAADLPKTIPV